MVGTAEGVPSRSPPTSRPTPWALFGPDHFSGGPSERASADTGNVSAGAADAPSVRSCAKVADIQAAIVTRGTPPAQTAHEGWAWPA